MGKERAVESAKGLPFLSPHAETEQALGFLTTECVTGTGLTMQLLPLSSWTFGADVSAHSSQIMSFPLLREGSFCSLGLSLLAV